MFALPPLPLQWRGGVLQELFKNKGTPSSPENYRDVMLGSVPGKCFPSHIRSHLVPVAKVLCGGSQFGSGPNGGETAFAHLYVRLFFDYCEHYKLSCANIFMDIVTAFAVLLRRILFDEYDNDETWLRKLSSAGFSDDDISSVMDVINDREWVNDVICRSGGCSFAWGLVNKFYCNTRFSQDYVEGVVRTSLGCMAGTPPADIIYALAFSRVLAKFNDALDAHGLRSSLVAHEGPPLDLVDVDYCDDTVVPVVAPAHELVTKCVDIVYYACAVFTFYGLVLNFATNKTNVMARFVGKGSVGAKRELFFSGNEVSFDLYGSAICLKFVDAYKHMGTKFSLTHDLSQEVSTRAAVIRSSTKAIKSVIRNPKFPLKAKLNIARLNMVLAIRSIVLSILFTVLSAWSFFTIGLGFLITLNTVRLSVVLT